jgi:hypothetical protein
MEIIYHGNRESAALTIMKTHHSYYGCELPQTFWELASWYTFFPEKYSNLADEKMTCFHVIQKVISMSASTHHWILP